MSNPLSILIPDDRENLQLPNPELVTFYTDLSHRVYWIAEEIDEYSLEIIRKIIDWNREDKDIPVEERKPIRLLFFTPGGDLDVNNSLVDTIKLSKTPVYGYNMGMCCSAGAFIYLACHKRFMLPHAYFLFHQGSIDMFSGGTFSQMVAFMEDYQLKVADLTEYLKENTTYPEEVLLGRIQGEWYVYKDEAIKNGVCDKVIESLEVLYT